MRNEYTAKHMTKCVDKVINVKSNKLYKQLIFSLVIIVMSIAMLVTSTFAWFSDEIELTGSRVLSGNLNVDLLTTSEYLDEKEYDKSTLKTYNRDVEIDGNVESQEFYIITDTNIPVINLSNVEPGQWFNVSFVVANTGDLGEVFSAGFNIQESLTGIETLQKKYEDGEIAETEHNLRLDKLTSTQIYDDKNVGGHLEDILQVYKGTSEDDIIPENYIGVISQLIAGNISNWHGYLLPKADITDDEGIVHPSDIYVYDGTQTQIDIIEGVSETSNLDFIIKMPDRADTSFEYASIKMGLGVSATQAEYEFDGTKYMIYDDTNAKRPIQNLDRFSRIKFKDCDKIFTVISSNVDTREVKLACLETVGSGLEILNPKQGTYLDDTALFRRSARYSQIDNYLNYVWFEDLPDNVKNSILYKELDVGSYTIASNAPSDLDYFTVHMDSSELNNQYLVYHDFDDYFGFRRVVPLTIDDLAFNSIVSYDSYLELIDETSISDVALMNYSGSDKHSYNKVLYIDKDVSSFEVCEKEFDDDTIIVIPVITLDFSPGIGYEIID